MKNIIPITIGITSGILAVIAMVGMINDLKYKEFQEIEQTRRLESLITQGATTCEVTGSFTIIEETIIARCL